MYIYICRLVNSNMFVTVVVVNADIVAKVGINAVVFVDVELMNSASVTYDLTKGSLILKESV